MSVTNEATVRTAGEIIPPGAGDQTALYRLYGANKDLLYVGISLNPMSRWEQHRNDKEWWAEVTSYEIAWYPTRSKARAAEVEAIRTESPRYNIADAMIEGRGKGNTPMRPMRIPDDEWDAFGELVGSRARTQLVRAFIRWYLRRPGAKLPPRPASGTSTEGQAGR